MSSGDLRTKVQASWASIFIAISPIREFLEASSLHGLVYISKAESVWGRFLWGLSVIVSFSLAFVLINISFAD